MESFAPFFVQSALMTAPVCLCTHTYTISHHLFTIPEIPLLYNLIPCPFYMFATTLRAVYTLISVSWNYFRRLNFKYPQRSTVTQALSRLVSVKYYHRPARLWNYRLVHVYRIKLDILRDKRTTQTLSRRVRYIT